MGIFGKKKPAADSETPSIDSTDRKGGSPKGGGTPAKATPKPKPISKIQEEALLALPQRKLFIVLHIRAEPPKPNDLHWGFYYHQGPKGGMRYHVTNTLGSANNWFPDFGFTRGVLKSMRLDVLIQIGSIPDKQEAQLDRLMKHYNEYLNAMAGVTCRVWVLKIVELLVQHGLIRCQDVGALEQECFAIGNKYARDCAENNQPRPVLVSTKSS